MRIIPALLIVLMLSTGAYAAAWDFNERQDFEQGTFYNMVADKGYLEISRIPTSTHHYVYISGFGTSSVVKYDSRYLAPVAEYRLPPKPGQVSVDSKLNVWVGSHEDGSIVKIASSTNFCVDRNRNGVIDTSYDANGDGKISDDEVVGGAPTGPDLAGTDECVLLYVDTGDDECALETGLGSGGSVRGIVFDDNGYVWAGLFCKREVIKIDPDTGEIIAHIKTGDSPGNAPDNILQAGGPFDLVIDKQGFLWVDNCYHRTLAKINTNDDKLIGIYPLFPGEDIWGKPAMTGIAAAGGKIWLYSTQDGPAPYGLFTFDPDSGKTTHIGHPTGSGSWALTEDWDGNLWVPVGWDANVLTKYDVASSKWTCSIPATPNPYFVSQGSDGSIWVVSNNGAAMKVNRTTCSVMGRIDENSGGTMMNRDFAGMARIPGVVEGVWVAYLRDETPSPKTEWSFTWDVTNDKDGSTYVEVRAPQDEQFVGVQNGGMIELDGNRAIVRVSFLSNRDGTSPNLVRLKAESRTYTPPTVESGILLNDPNCAVLTKYPGTSGYNYWCSPWGEWVQDSSDTNNRWLCRSPEIWRLAPNITGYRDITCCGDDMCWNGTGFVFEQINKSHYDGTVNLPKPENSYRCIGGEWRQMPAKATWDNSQLGFCPEYDVFAPKGGASRPENVTRPPPPPPPPPPPKNDSCVPTTVLIPCAKTPDSIKQDAVLDMRFESNSGNEATSTRDSSKSANLGTVSGAAWNSKGSPSADGAYHFDGSNDRIVMRDNFPFASTAALSLTAWVKLDKYGTSSIYSNPFVSSWYYSGLRLNSILWREYGGKIYFSYEGSNKKEATSSYAHSLALNTWYQLGVVFNNGRVEHYVDGVIVHNQTMGVPNIARSKYPILIGDWFNLRNRVFKPFAGWLDDVTIWSRALAPDDLKILHDGCVPEKIVKECPPELEPPTPPPVEAPKGGLIGDIGVQLPVSPAQLIPSYPRCLVKATNDDRNIQNNDNVIAYYDKGFEPACIRAGQYIEDHYCDDNGNWTTRTKLLALTMLSLVEQGSLAGEPFTLYCDEPAKMFNDPSVLGQQGIIGKPGVCPAGRNGDKEASCYNNFCLLRVKDISVLGTSLNSDFEAEPSFAKVIGNVSKDSCRNVVDLNWGECDSPGLYYNRPNQLVIFVPDSQSISFGATDVLSKAMSERKGRIITKVSDIGSDATTKGGYRFFGQRNNFDVLYAARNGDRYLFGVVERGVSLKPGRSAASTDRHDFVGVSYQGPSFDVCKFIEARDAGALCAQDSTTSGSEVVIAQQRIAGQQSPLVDAWRDLTAKLRP